MMHLHLVVLLLTILTRIAYARNQCVVVFDGQDDYIECKDITSLATVVARWEDSWESLRIINRIDFTLMVADLPQNSLTDSLIKLDLSQAGKINIVGTGFKDFTSLRLLNLSNTGLESIHNSWYPRKLQTLDLSGNNLNLSPTQFRNLGQLTELRLGSNYISNIPSNLFANIPKLSSLYLSFNEIEHIRDIGTVPGLKNLIVAYNSISQINKEDFAGLEKLEKLDVSFNSISEIEDGSFSVLQSIREIDLSGNNLERISSDFFGDGDYPNLETLKFSGNRIKILENNEFNTLNHLKLLELSDNVLQNLDKSSFSGLGSLISLNLSKNEILNINANTFETLQKIEVLDLSKNRIQTLDGNVFGFSGDKLKDFFLSKNSLEVLQPHLFEPIRNVRTVDVSFNKLKRFDENLFPPLTKISKLFLNHNEIEDLPESFYDLFKTLNEVAIDHNKLTFLKLSAVPIRRLRKISLQGNPWQCKCLDEIINAVATKNVDYLGGLNSDGDKAICVETKISYCMTDPQDTMRAQILQNYAGTHN